MVLLLILKSSPNDKILDMSTFKVFADNKISVIIKLECVLEWVENTVEEGVNAGFQYFLLFQQCFQMASLSGSLNRDGQRTYPCFPRVLLTSIQHIILSKPMAAFPYKHCQNNGQK